MPPLSHTLPLFLHLQEIEFGQRMIFSVILGGIIGFERRASERPAGIRTMSMVCLGSCFFCMASQLAFKSSTMGWDAARVAAAVPSGVGFLGAGLIWKGNTTQTKTVDGAVVKSTSQEVHGLTTAASVWLSAAVGVAVGGGRRLYIVSVYGVALVILVLRFGPQMYFAKDSESMVDWDDQSDISGWESFTDDSSQDLSHMDEHEMNDLAYKKGLQRFNEPVHDYAGDEEDHQHMYSPVTKNREVEPLLESQKSTPLVASSSSLSRHSRHASAPDLSTYLTPIIDHSRLINLESGGLNAKDGDKGGDCVQSKSLRRKARKKRESNVLKLSFHG